MKMLFSHRCFYLSVKYKGPIHVAKTLLAEGGVQNLYKGNEIVTVFDIDRNVPEGEEPIIYIEMIDGKKRDTPLMNLSMIPDDPSEDEYDEDNEDDEDDDTFYSLDDSGELMLGGGEIKGAEKVSQKLINSFF